MKATRSTTFLISLALVTAACSASNSAQQATTTTSGDEPATTLSEKQQQVEERKADPDIQEWCSLHPEGYVDHEGRGVAYDTFGRYFPDVGDPDAMADALPELLEYERQRMESAPAEIESALSSAILALEAFMMELEAVNWNIENLASEHANALAFDPSWGELAVFEGTYCGTTPGLG